MQEHEDPLSRGEWEDWQHWEASGRNTGDLGTVTQTGTGAAPIRGEALMRALGVGPDGALQNLQAQEAEQEPYNAPWGREHHQRIEVNTSGNESQELVSHLVAATKTKRCLLRNSQSSTFWGHFLRTLTF